MSDEEIRLISHIVMSSNLVKWLIFGTLRKSTQLKKKCDNKNCKQMFFGLWVVTV